MNSENIFSVSLFFFSRTMDLEHFPIMSNYAEYLCSDQWGGTWTKLVDQSVFRKPFFFLPVSSFKTFSTACLNVWTQRTQQKKTRSVHCKFPEVFLLEHVFFEITARRHGCLVEAEVDKFRLQGSCQAVKHCICEFLVCVSLWLWHTTEVRQTKSGLIPVVNWAGARNCSKGKWQRSANGEINLH